MVGQKTRLFLKVDNLVAVNGRKACDRSKVSIFCVEKYKTAVVSLIYVTIETFRLLARDVIYTSRAYAMMPVSVCLSVCL